MKVLSWLSDNIYPKKLPIIAISTGALFVTFQILKKLYLNYYDRVEYVTLKDIVSKRQKYYDFIVIGSGSAGSCVAGMLTRDNRKPKILLIEAGPPDTYYPLANSVIPFFGSRNRSGNKDWQYNIAPFNGKNLHKWPQGKVMGGTSYFNAMVYVRGNEADYNEWCNKYKCKGWSYKDVLPIFKSFEKCVFKSETKENENVRGYNGFQKISKLPENKQHKLSKLFVEASINAGYKFNDDYNGINQDGVNYTQHNIDENGRRLTSFRAFIATLFSNRNRYSNIDILPNSQVTKILCDNSENKIRAIGVEIGCNAEQRIFINEKNSGEIIMSAGTVGSPHLLLLSGIGDKQQLSKYDIKCISDIKGVGNNLRDHFKQCLFCSVPSNQVPDLSIVTGAYLPYLFQANGILSSIGIDAQIFTKSCVAKRNKSQTNDLQIVTTSIPDRRDTATNAQSKLKLKNENEINTPYQFAIGADVVRPKSIGYIRLKSNNPYIQPEINPNYLSNKQDLEICVDGIIQAANILKQEPLKSLGFKIIEYEGFDTIKQYAEYITKHNLLTLYHPVGTCKMGDINNDKMAVCDERLKVKGFQNLRVCDASIAPDLIAGNIQGMCFMIGCKGAKMILEDWNPNKTE